MPKTALVTGSAGFIGRHMVRELEGRGYQVSGWDIVDVDRKGRDGDCLKLFGPNGGDRSFDLVVHCAFHVGGRAAIDGINTNFLKNLQLDSVMFEWAVRTKQKRVLYFSSSAAYPVNMQSQDWIKVETSEGFQRTLDELRLKEDWFPDGLEPSEADANYGFAKAVGERMAEDARRSGLPVTVVRPFSGYGEDQSLDYPFPSIVNRARQGDLSVWGPPGQCRDWIHVDDVVKGALAVVESGTEDPVNLCTGVGTEMGELACRAYELANGAKPRTFPHDKYGNVKYLTDKPTGVFFRVGDPARFNQYYTPQVSLEEGIRRALKA